MRDTDEDRLLLMNLFSNGTSRTLRYWPGRRGQELVEGCEGS
jgi:hypothetical protein